MSESMLPTVPVRNEARLSGWFGMWTLIATEASLFVYLLFSYYYLKLQTDQPWPPEGPPRLLLSSVNTFLLLTSSLFVYFGERKLKQDRKKAAVALIAIAIAFGTAFVLIQLKEWSRKSFSISTHLYGSLYFTITGFHLLHVVLGMGMLAVVSAWTAMGYCTKSEHGPVSAAALYWHFVDAVWIFIFGTFFIVPYL